jgi:hypothetical protein
LLSNLYIIHNTFGLGLINVNSLNEQLGRDGLGSLESGLLGSNHFGASVLLGERPLFNFEYVLGRRLNQVISNYVHCLNKLIVIYFSFVNKCYQNYFGNQPDWVNLL